MYGELAIYVVKTVREGVAKIYSLAFGIALSVHIAMFYTTELLPIYVAIAALFTVSAILSDRAIVSSLYRSLHLCGARKKAKVSVLLTYLAMYTLLASAIPTATCLSLGYSTLAIEITGICAVASGATLYGLWVSSRRG